MMTLWDLPRGKLANIVGVARYLPPAVQQRLQEMGFSPGNQVSCLQHGPFSGPIVVAVGDSVYSLEQAIAAELFISDIRQSEATG